MSKDPHRFYMPHLRSETVQILEGDEAAHAGRVLRLEAGAMVIICDGKGKGVLAEILDMKKKSFEFKIMEELESEIEAPAFHLVIAPTKNMDRLEWCMEKCTEIGLARITPILCQNSERRKLRLDRLQKIGIAAMKQSKTFYLPQVEDFVKVEQFLNEKPADGGELLIAHCREGDKLDTKDVVLPASLMIGPEGDFTQEEVEMALRLGAKAVHLGPKRLRTETAAVVACTLLNL
jgi:16S rRNA (uracil1498-N3)-methyltransferase